ncbi:hypothetical protein GOP47_0010854 [Adiantum capillus-veneris]|uniref:Uncharacterized protein n=1 Tax=Adiantum capillus-veneris TaxID=13818 RepID=A0A9D4UVQ7_ADICA|nr:hypothetical protein GOP47_0010854 [Adiantum capillus-veneris]
MLDGTFRDDFCATYVVDYSIRREEIELVHADDCFKAFDNPEQVILQRVGHRVIYTDSAQHRYQLERRASSRRLSRDVVTLVGEPRDRCYESTAGTEFYFLTCGLLYDPRPTQRPVSSRSPSPPLDIVPPPRTLRRPPPGFSSPRPDLLPGVSSYHDSRAMHTSASASTLRTTHSETESESPRATYFRESPPRHLAPSRDPSSPLVTYIRDHTREATMTPTPSLRAPEFGHGRLHIVDMSAPRPLTTTLQAPLEARETAGSTIQIEGQILCIIGQYQRGVAFYVDLHDHLYVRMADPQRPLYLPRQIVRVYTQADRAVLIDELGEQYHSIETLDFNDIERAHPDDRLDTQTHPRLVELHRVEQTMTYLDELGHRYIRLSIGGSRDPSAHFLAHLIGDPRERVYRDTGHGVYILTIGLPYSLRLRHHDLCLPTTAMLAPRLPGAPSPPVTPVAISPILTSE